MDTHQLVDVTVVADAGMISAANRKEIEEAGLSFVPEVPYMVDAWRCHHPDQPIPDGHIFTQPRAGRPRPTSGSGPAMVDGGFVGCRVK